jgi:ABC-type transport system involved in cytochrome bd biosynthesis fused ATPase/permease subunit
VLLVTHRTEAQAGADRVFYLSGGRLLSQPPASVA